MAHTEFRRVCLGHSHWLRLLRFDRSCGEFFGNLLRRMNPTDGEESSEERPNPDDWDEGFDAATRLALGIGDVTEVAPL